MGFRFIKKCISKFNKFKQGEYPREMVGKMKDKNIITLNGKKYKLIEDMEKKEKKEYAKPTWGNFADLTPEFLEQTMIMNGVKYHRHPNGGGWVSEKAQVDDTVWVGAFAVIHNGVVKDQAIIHDRAVVDCDGLQDGADFNVGGSAQVLNSAQILDSAQIFDSIHPFGLIRMYGSAQIWETENEITRR